MVLIISSSVTLHYILIINYKYVGANVVANFVNMCLLRQITINNKTKKIYTSYFTNFYFYINIETS
jgi:hypothetical protein